MSKNNKPKKITVEQVEASERLIESSYGLTDLDTNVTYDASVNVHVMPRGDGGDDEHMVVIHAACPLGMIREFFPRLVEDFLETTVEQVNQMLREDTGGCAVIQRYTTKNHPSGHVDMVPDPEGEFVRYVDHEAILHDYRVILSGRTFSTPQHWDLPEPQRWREGTLLRAKEGEE